MTDANPVEGAASSAARGTRIEVVLFDIGGVLADFAGLETLREMMGAESELEAATRWLMSPWVRRFESGRCTDAEFAAGAVQEFGLPFTAEDFLGHFLDWLSDPFDGAEQLVRDTKKQVAVGCLSNTNSLHWQRRISHWPLTALFEHRFLSFELGAVKPDRTIFDLVAERLPVPASNVLFVDDNPLNVSGARAAGLQSEETRGVAEARAALVSHGLI